MTRLSVSRGDCYCLFNIEYIRPKKKKKNVMECSPQLSPAICLCDIKYIRRRKKVMQCSLQLSPAICLCDIKYTDEEQGYAMLTLSLSSYLFMWYKIYRRRTRLCAVDLISLQLSCWVTLLVFFPLHLLVASRAGTKPGASRHWSPGGERCRRRKRSTVLLEKTRTGMS